MENSCWQVLSQSDGFLQLEDKDKETLFRLLQYEGDLKDIRLNDVFQIPDDNSTIQELPEATFDSDDFIDKRICAIKFNNFRLFRLPHDAIPYGVNFLKNGKPCSLFLVGGNGTGKSSVYSALELHYTGFCSHAKEMGCRLEDYLTYGLNRINGIQAESVSLGVVRKDLNSEVRQNLKSFVPVCSTSSMFCSDYDVEQIRQNGNTLYEYILQQLGCGRLSFYYSCVTELLKTLDTFLVGLKPSDDTLSVSGFNSVIQQFFHLSSNADELKECKQYSEPQNISDRLDGVKHLDNPKLFVKEWGELEKLQKSQNAAAPVVGALVQSLVSNQKEYESRIHTLSILYAEYKNILLSKESMRNDEKYPDEESVLLALAEDLMKRKTEMQDRESQSLVDSNTVQNMENQKVVLENIKDLIRKTKQQIVQSFSSEFRKDFQDILVEFSDNGETFSLDVASNSIKLNIHVPTEDGDFITDPYEYFNSFRFKLFCITLKIILSFYWMKRNKTIVPFVIDDVFNANDFNNGLKLQQYVYQIYKWYDMKLVKESHCQIPFQLVMFTHDDLMLSAFKKGYCYQSEKDFIREKYIKSSSMDMICGRLFPYKVIEKAQKVNSMRFKNLYL